MLGSAGPCDSFILSLIHYTPDKMDVNCVLGAKGTEQHNTAPLLQEASPGWGGRETDVLWEIGDPPWWAAEGGREGNTFSWPPFEKKCSSQSSLSVGDKHNLKFLGGA